MWCFDARLYLSAAALMSFEKGAPCCELNDYGFAGQRFVARYFERNLLASFFSSSLKFQSLTLPRSRRSFE
jgi:hypothetical protein